VSHIPKFGDENKSPNCGICDTADDLQRIEQLCTMSIKIQDYSLKICYGF
jgi:hypothetical protein